MILKTLLLLFYVSYKLVLYYIYITSISNSNWTKWGQIQRDVGGWTAQGEEEEEVGSKMAE